MPVREDTAELAKELKAKRPHVIYWLGHAEPEALYLGTERIDLADLRRLLRSLPRRPGRPSGLVFLNACQTAEPSDLGSFLKAFHDARLQRHHRHRGADARHLRQPVRPRRPGAVPRPQSKPIGGMLHELRRRHVPAGPALRHLLPARPARPAPSRRRPRRPAGLARADLTAVGAGRGGRRRLGGGRRRRTSARRRSPTTPYLPLASYGPEHRALFAGRDDDVDRFALILGGPRRGSWCSTARAASASRRSSAPAASLTSRRNASATASSATARTPRPASARRSVLFVRATDDLAGQIAQALPRLRRHARSATRPRPATRSTVDLPACWRARSVSPAPVGRSPARGGCSTTRRCSAGSSAGSPAPARYARPGDRPGRGDLHARAGPRGDARAATGP